MLPVQHKRSFFVKIQTKHKEENVCTEKKSSQLEMLQKRKIEFLKKSPLGYLLASVLAGMFIGFGILLIFTIGGLLDGAPYTKIIMGVSFGIALSLVVIAGAELFTETIWS